ncbi:MAG: LuxR C-terminal-related transcriptional regulator [Treponema sp.]|nr:LuxR C-terminal-related transcriptional regulator [Treponema sp.]
MFKKNVIDTGSDNSIQNGDYLERPRLHALLKKAMDYPLIIICAGSGYGKTYALYSFLSNYDAIAPWMQISERDNIPLRIWESICRMSLMVSQEYSSRLTEIGFPKTDEAFLKFMDAMSQHIACHPGKIIGVFDDFHLLQNPEILSFFERMVTSSPLNMPIILITRSMPEINLVSMSMRGKVFTIQEDMLRFTEDEIAKYFNQLNLPVTNVDIRNIYDDTQGWAFALNLIARSLTKKRKYERYALEAMKKNIFRLMEAEIIQTIPQRLLRFLLRISLLDHHAADLIKTLASFSETSDGESGSLIREMEMINACIRYDYNQDTYMIHHLFRDYLRKKQEKILTDDERREVYKAAAVWCEANSYHTDALSYYEKAGDYDAITRKIISLNIQIPQDMASYALDIFNRIPEDVKSTNQLFPAMYIKLKLNLGQFEEAQEIAVKYSTDYEARPETPERNRALTILYGAWSALRIKMCTFTDIYDFDIYSRKMSEYYDRNPFKIIGSYKVTSMTSRACLVGTNRPGAMEEYIAAISRAAPNMSHVLNGFHEGFEELVRGEFCFSRMEFNKAAEYLNQSIAKARGHDQYVTQNRALVYLMHINFSHGNTEAAAANLKEMEALLSEKDYGVRYTMYDIAQSFYHLLLGQPEKIPEWLKGDFMPYTHPSFLENYANRVRMRYHYQTCHYSALLAFIENTLEHPVILYDKIELKIMQALSLYQFKRYSEAFSVFTEAYHLAESNKLIALFVQFAKDMRTLSAAALKYSDCTIPKKWLEDINHKSSTLAKRKAKLISEYAAANNPGKGIKLTKREIDILKDLSDGLSRTEIASSRNLSVNTVKMTINIIYDKLGVISLGEAIRAAAEHKII